MKLTIVQILKQAVDSHKKNDLDEAEKHYKDILKIDPVNPHANHNLALIAISRNKGSNALPFFRSAIKANPNMEIFWINFIHTLLAENLPDEAETNCRKLLAIKPESAKAHYYLADTLHILDKFKEAETSYKKAIELQANFAEAYNNLGRVLLKLGSFKESEINCKKAIEFKPDFADAYRNLGETLNKLDRFEDAVNSYKKAISLNPKFIKAYSLLSITLSSLNKQDEAVKCLRKIIEIQPDHQEANINLSILLRQKKILSRILASRNVKNKSDVNLNSTVKTFNKLITNPFISNRTVEAELINNLYEINSKGLEKTKGIFFGKGRHSADFNLFKSNYPLIKKVEDDLISVMKKALNSEIGIIDSFFNILVAGGGSNPHHHLNEFDKKNKLINQKYSLTYYLSVGDQNCSDPGILKLKNPDEDILPSEGMILIFPADRTHSAVYGGNKDRVMIGVNFYSII